ncbi:hypothetical protein DEO72_LG7g1318 [Vigna unguiculata]|uniref:Uncharacterized protein n=1 Tax=Vigna unguiculata TaxID=3917 RepID=A0A4D6MHK6_VIGUN|nr:hypothetical protein DEO72_LG7g1318 [Vigna unguiculata]
MVYKSASLGLERAVRRRPSRLKRPTTVMEDDLHRGRRCPRHQHLARILLRGQQTLQCRWRLHSGINQSRTTKSSSWCRASTAYCTVCEPPHEWLVRVRQRN